MLPWVTSWDGGCADVPKLLGLCVPLAVQSKFGQFWNREKLRAYHSCCCYPWWFRRPFNAVVELLWVVVDSRLRCGTPWPGAAYLSPAGDRDIPLNFRLDWGRFRRLF